MKTLPKRSPLTMTTEEMDTESSKDLSDPSTSPSHLNTSPSKDNNQISDYDSDCSTIPPSPIVEDSDPVIKIESPSSSISPEEENIAPQVSPPSKDPSNNFNLHHQLQMASVSSSLFIPFAEERECNAEFEKYCAKYQDQPQQQQSPPQTPGQLKGSYPLLEELLSIKREFVEQKFIPAQFPRQQQIDMTNWMSEQTTISEGCGDEVKINPNPLKRKVFTDVGYVEEKPISNKTAASLKSLINKRRKSCSDDSSKKEEMMRTMNNNRFEQQLTGLCGYTTLNGVTYAVFKRPETLTPHPLTTFTVACTQEMNSMTASDIEPILSQLESSLFSPSLTESLSSSSSSTTESSILDKTGPDSSEEEEKGLVILESDDFVHLESFIATFMTSEGEIKWDSENHDFY